MALASETPSIANASETGVPLSSLAPGQSGTVIGVDTSRPEGLRLLELGFLPETEIRVVRRAPLRDPIVFYLRGAQICLRGSEAALVQVRANPTEPTV
jgi:ferrous iron transport protein A